MVFVSDKQRKAVMAKLRAGKFIVEPAILKLTPAQQKFIRKKVSKNIKEGRPPKQAVAISFSQARKKFGNSRLKKDNKQLSPKSRIVAQKIKKIIPKLSKKESVELRKVILKKLKLSNPGNPDGTSKIPLINLIPLLIGTFIILSVLKAAQTIIKKRKKSQ